MVLTSSYRRRTAGFTALFAALLLVLTALFAISPATAQQGSPTTECGEGGNWIKIQGGSSTDTDLTVGNYDFQSAQVGDTITVMDGGGTVITITVTAVKSGESILTGADDEGEAVTLTVSLSSDADFTITIVLKAGSTDDADGGTLLPGQSESVTTLDGNTPNNAGISHLTLCLGDLPDDKDKEVTPEKPDFTDPDCDTEAAVDLPETEGVDYGIEGDITPGGTVTVTATPQAGYKFPDDAKTVWEHTFAEVPEDCDEPVEVTTDEPTFTDPTCDMNQIGLDVPETTGVVYTVTGDQEPGGTVTVTAAAAEGYVLAEDAETEWQHTYGPLATDCGGVGGSETDPAASVLVNCAVAQITLDNTGSDVAVTYTITGVAGYDAVEVPAGEQQTIDDLGIAEDADYDITVSANGMDDATAAGNYNCVTPTTDVSPDVVEKPAPDPAPTAQPAAQPAAQELPATGLGSTELLLLALLMLGLGTAALLGSDPRRQI